MTSGVIARGKPCSMGSYLKNKIYVTYWTTKNNWKGKVIRKAGTEKSLTNSCLRVSFSRMAMLLSSFSFEMVDPAYRGYSQMLCNFKKMHCLSINSNTRKFDSTTSKHLPFVFLIRKEISWERKREIDIPVVDKEIKKKLLGWRWRRK